MANQCGRRLAGIQPFSLSSLSSLALYPASGRSVSNCIIIDDHQIDGQRHFELVTLVSWSKFALSVPWEIKTDYKLCKWCMTYRRLHTSWRRWWCRSWNDRGHTMYLASSRGDCWSTPRPNGRKGHCRGTCCLHSTLCLSY